MVAKIALFIGNLLLVEGAKQCDTQGRDGCIQLLRDVCNAQCGDNTQCHDECTEDSATSPYNCCAPFGCQAETCAVAVTVEATQCDTQGRDGCIQLLRDVCNTQCGDNTQCHSECTDDSATSPYNCCAPYGCQAETCAVAVTVEATQCDTQGRDGCIQLLRDVCNAQCGDNTQCHDECINDSATSPYRCCAPYGCQAETCAVAVTVKATQCDTQGRDGCNQLLRDVCNGQCGDNKQCSDECIQAESVAEDCCGVYGCPEEDCAVAVTVEATQCDTQCRDVCNQPFTAGGPDCCGACGCPEEDCVVTAGQAV